FWPMPFVCDALGIRLHGQLSKFHPPRYTAMKYDIAVPGRPRRTGMVCLPQPEFEFWLKTLNVQKGVASVPAPGREPQSSHLWSAHDADRNGIFGRGRRADARARLASKASRTRRTRRSEQRIRGVVPNRKRP